MRRAKRDGLQPEIRKVRERVERWRGTRAKRSPMPDKLWAAAVALAQTHGVYRISQDLGVNYDSLKARLAKAGRGARSRGRRSQVRRATGNGQPKFVELEPMPALATLGSDGVLVEVQDATGSKLTIRLDATSTVDVCAVLAAFRGEGHGRRRR